MSVESFLQSQGKKKSNFKQVAGKLLAEKEPVETRPWKWEEEVTNEDWSKMEQTLEAHGPHSGSFYASQAADMHVFDPNHSIHISEKRWTSMKKSLETVADSRLGDEANFAILAACMHLIDPKLPDSHALVWDSLEDGLKNREYEFLRSGEDVHYSDLAWAMRILNPDYSLQIGGATMKKMNEKLEEYKMENDWLSFARLASTMRLFDKDFSVSIAIDAWDGMKDKIEYLRRQPLGSGEWSVFSRFIASMRILAAHKVEVTKEGIVITDEPESPRSSFDEIPKRPVRRKK